VLKDLFFLPTTLRNVTLIPISKTVISRLTEMYVLGVKKTLFLLTLNAKNLKLISVKSTVIMNLKRNVLYAPPMNKNVLDAKKSIT
jgi:hypothetical protein